MKLIYILIFSVIAFSQIAHAMELYKNVPTLEGVTWLGEEEDLKEKKEIHIVYFWATWCAPCGISTKEVIQLTKRNPKKISVVAISKEEESLVKDYLKENYLKSGLPFSYGILPKEISDANPYGKKVPYLPYMFVIQKGKLVWMGNPTYPKGEFTNLVGQLLTGKWSEAVAKKKALELERLEAQLRKIKSEKKQLARKLIDKGNESYLVLKDLRALSPNNFIPYREEFYQLHQSFFLEYNILSPKDGKKIISDYHKRISQLLEKEISAFSDSRDDLVYIGSDIFGITNENLQHFKYGHQIIDRLAKLKKQEASYPDYQVLLEANSAFRKGMHKRSQELAKKAVTMSKELKRPKYFTNIFKSQLNEFEKAEKHECYNFSTCIKSAFGFL